MLGIDVFVGAQQLDGIFQPAAIELMAPHQFVQFLDEFVPSSRPSRRPWFIRIAISLSKRPSSSPKQRRTSLGLLNLLLSALSPVRSRVLTGNGQSRTPWRPVGQYASVISLFPRLKSHAGKIPSTVGVKPRAPRQRRPDGRDRLACHDNGLAPPANRTRHAQATFAMSSAPPRG